MFKAFKRDWKWKTVANTLSGKPIKKMTLLYYGRCGDEILERSVYENCVMQKGQCPCFQIKGGGYMYLGDCPSKYNDDDLIWINRIQKVYVFCSLGNDSYFIGLRDDEGYWSIILQMGEDAPEGDNKDGAKKNLNRVPSAGSLMEYRM